MRTFNQIRSALYWMARRMGDVRAIEQSITKKSLDPALRRILRIVLGRALGRLIGRI